MTHRLPLVVCLLFTVVAMAQQDRRQAALDQVQQGVASFRGANFEGAIEHFHLAVQWDPELWVARIYLATTYARQYIPGVETPENVARANKALEEYGELLRRKPDDLTAIKGIADVNMLLKHLDEARAGYRQASEIDPKDPDAFYSMGVVDWTLAYRAVMDEKGKLKSKSKYAMILSPGCDALRVEQMPNIEDGIAMITRAIDLRKSYDDAMAYMNLLLRIRAELECGDKAAHQADIGKANQWAHLADEAKKHKSGGIVLESNQLYVDRSPK